MSVQDDVGFATLACMSVACHTEVATGSKALGLRIRKASRDRAPDSPCRARAGARTARPDEEGPSSRHTPELGVFAFLETENGCSR
jgi:hypothetical protein